MSNALTAVNRLLAPSGTADTTLNQGGTLLAGGLSAIFTSVPSNWPAVGILRGIIYKVGDTNHEVIDIDLSSRSSFTFTIARQTEEATALPACSHADGAGIWIVATAAMLQAPAGVGYEDLCTGDATLTPSNTFVDVPGVTHTLAPGVWDVRAVAYFDYQGVGGGSGSIAFKITDGTNDYFGGDSVISPGWVQSCTGLKRITLTATTTIKMQARGQTAGTHIRQYLQVPGGTIPGTLLQCFPVGGSPAITEYVYIRDEKAQGTDGGTFSNAAWRTRVLNTKVKDTGGIATLASNQITLPAGDYYIRASAPTYQVGSNRLRLYNITDSAVLLLGENARDGTASSEAGPAATIEGPFTLTAPKTVELQHHGTSTSNTFGFGVATNFSSTVEVYAEVHLWRGAAVTGGPFGGDGSGQWVKLATLAPAGATNVDFTNIPSGYKHLQIRWRAKGTNGAGQLATMQLNGDTGANYAWTRQFVTAGGLSSGAENNSDTSFNVLAVSSSAGSIANSGEINFEGYAETVFDKTFRSETQHWDGVHNYTELCSGIWVSTAVINRIKITIAAGNFATGSIFDLYGIA